MSNETYDHIAFETKWQKKWSETKLYRQQIDKDKPKHYALTMLPYPSGDMHIGHWYAMTPSDARARYMRMKGYNVLFPMGFDAFGLPAENAAIKHNIHPAKWTYANIENMRKQMRRMGTMFDWEREAISSDPSYYYWSQWFFKKFLERGLAYREFGAVNFCPHCNTTLAREQVWGEDRHCERCGTPVIMKELEQWYFRATNYAEELLDFSAIDWPERVQTMQTNWIGKSTGAEVIFTSEAGDEMPIFTTRPDTLWGATFMVMAPEHPLVAKLTKAEQKETVDDYVAASQRMDSIERETADREKTGVFSGAYAINPVNQARIPIWIADYVLMGYGFGAIMAVPAHDERDFAFAKKYDLPIVEVIQMPEREGTDDPLAEAFTSKTEGQMINSGEFDGTPVNIAINKVTNWLEEKGIGKKAVNYRLRDWLVSRQRYWGCPIPIIYCPTHGAVPVPDEDLPVLLPDDVEFLPTGESPLKFHEGFLHTECPICGTPATRETDTLDTFICSSWYQYRYLSPKDDQRAFDEEEGAYWLPVDHYTGGIEHATMHLIYTRFFTKAMRDIGLVDFDEPMLALFNQGMVLGEDGDKMSKSRGNVVAPDPLVDRYGADVVRLFLMFFSKWDQGGPWSYTGIRGPHRFVQDLWRLGRISYIPNVIDNQAESALRRKTHQTIRKVSGDLEAMSFNTAIAAMMEMRNIMNNAARDANVSAMAWDEAIDNLLLMAAPFMPHITEELWSQRGYAYSIHQQSWPQWDAGIAAEETITAIIQINGKVRDRIVVNAGISEADLQQTALKSDKIQDWLNSKQPKKIIVIKGQLVNIVV